jgi:hypothetical protein
VKNIIAILIAITVAALPLRAVAACDFAVDIKANTDGTYTYSRDCHIEVGKRVKKLELTEQRADELEKTIELKDLALVRQKERADLWMDTSVKVNDKLQSYESAAKSSDWLHFGLGVAVTVLSVWAAGQLR